MAWRAKASPKPLEVPVMNQTGLNSSALSSFLLSAEKSCCAVEKGPNETFALSVIRLSVTVNGTAACIKTLGPRNGKTLKCLDQPELRICAGMLTVRTRGDMLSGSYLLL